MILTHHALRTAFVVIILWMISEWIVFGVLINAIGLFLTILLLILKIFVGLALLGSNLRMIHTKLDRRVLRNGISELSDTFFAVLGAFLIMLPGIISALVGLALFSPSLRSGLARLLKREKKDMAKDGIISLDSSEWTEITSTKSPTPKRRPSSRQ